MEGTKLTETGRVIREKRIIAGFTQKTLAQALHITDKAVSKWERGLCLPDVSLLPKIAYLLDVDIDALVFKSTVQQGWVGLIDIEKVDFSQIIYDKPLVYYLLCHYLLLGITKIHFLTDETNELYLKKCDFGRFGFEFNYNVPQNVNTMILNRPWFIFGSDLTQQLQGAMMSGRNTKVVPDNQEPVFFFSHENNEYFKSKKKFARNAARRKLGRGMVCICADNLDKRLDIASFVRIYQNNSRMLIGALEEVAYKRGLISDKELEDMALELPYGDYLRLLVNHKSVEI